MRDFAGIRERAVRVAIRTGWSPDLDLIWNWQKQEGHEPCFGLFDDACSIRCRWFDDCRTVAQEPIDSPLPKPGPA